MIDLSVYVLVAAIAAGFAGYRIGRRAGHRDGVAAGWRAAYEANGHRPWGSPAEAKRWNFQTEIREKNGVIDVR